MFTKFRSTLGIIQRWPRASDGESISQFQAEIEQLHRQAGHKDEVNQALKESRDGRGEELAELRSKLEASDRRLDTSEAKLGLMRLRIEPFEEKEKAERELAQRNASKLHLVNEEAREFMLEVVACNEEIADDGLCDCARFHFEQIAEARSVFPLRSSPDDLRSQGWTVAVHRDFRLRGEPMTFWLLTNDRGQYVKGEGASDRAALDEIRKKLSERSLVVHPHTCFIWSSGVTDTPGCDCGALVPASDVGAHADTAREESEHSFTCPRCGSHYFGSSDSHTEGWIVYCHGEHKGEACRWKGSHSDHVKSVD